MTRVNFPSCISKTDYLIWNKQNLREKNQMSTSRLYSALTLQKILEKKLFLNEAQKQVPQASNQDMAFQNMLLLTCLRHLPYLKKILKSHTRKKLPASLAFATYALYLGITELLYLKTPDYAVINSYVEIIKQQLNKYVAGFANAVLRKVAQEKDTLLQQDRKDFFSQEFLGLLKNSYNKKTIHEIEQTAQQEPFLDITAKVPSETLAEKLNGKLLPGGTIRLSNDGAIQNLYGYQDGLWWVQDFAASLPVKILGNLKNKRVLDLCAAPGGKTAQLINAGAEVTALDISQERLNTLQQNLNRLHLKAENIICADALEYLQTFKDTPFDIILMDAPCSATGTLRRHPEIASIKKQTDVEKQTLLQKKLLEAVSPALKTGGILLYCVCSLCKEEGEWQIKNFLENSQEFRLSPVSKDFLPEAPEIFTPEGNIRTLPQHLKSYQGLDGFFISRLTKVKEHVF